MISWTSVESMVAYRLYRVSHNSVYKLHNFNDKLNISLIGWFGSPKKGWVCLWVCWPVIYTKKPPLPLTTASTRRRKEPHSRRKKSPSIAAHFSAIFCPQSLDIWMGHSLNLLLHTREGAVVQGVEVCRWRRTEVTKTSIFTENPQKSNFLGISLF